jgi:DNA-binding NtrC family response regulator
VQPQILIVDDDRTILTVLRRVLANHGFATREAGDVETALGIAYGEHIDLVVSDVVMPGRSGVELRRELSERSPAMPVILISGWALPAPAESASKLPNTRFMWKPFALNALILAISEMLCEQAGHQESVPAAR